MDSELHEEMLKIKENRKNIKSISNIIKETKEAELKNEERLNKNKSKNKITSNENPKKKNISQSSPPKKILNLSTSKPSHVEVKSKKVPDITKSNTHITIEKNFEGSSNNAFKTQLESDRGDTTRHMESKKEYYDKFESSSNTLNKKESTKHLEDDHKSYVRSNKPSESAFKLDYADLNQIKQISKTDLHKSVDIKPQSRGKSRGESRGLRMS